MPDNASEQWSSVLDQLENRLERYAATLLGGERPEPFTLPADLGQLPEQLADRARLIRARQYDLENRFRDRLSTIRDVLESDRESDRANSVYVDALS